MQFLGRPRWWQRVVTAAFQKLEQQWSAEDERQAPRVGAHAVGLVTPEEWVVATGAWLRDEAGAA